MRIYSQFILTIILSGLFFSTACSSPNPSGNSGNPPAPTPAGQNSPSTSQTANAAPSELPKANLPKSKDLDLQTNHANGSVLRVTAVNFVDDSISLDFSITNGYTQPIKLAQGRMQLRDDAGNVYNLSPPAQNPDIEVAANNNLKGKLTFLGRVAPNAKSLTLTTNYQYSSNSGAYDTTPYMVISNIPVER